MNAVAHLKEVQQGQYDKQEKHYSQLHTFYDPKYKAGWFQMHAAPRPCFTVELLKNIGAYFNSVKQEMKQSGSQKYDYLVLASEVDGVFNLGGDLELFSTLIENQDREGLLHYAMLCINVLYDNMVHLNDELTTIALVKGDALGGGFESALSSNVLIAERNAKMGLPEVLFNLFPGMGAYSVLSRKVGSALAEKMILSGKLYSAEELYDMGVVDVLAEEGEGELAVYRYINQANKMANTYQAVRKVKDICSSVSYEELVKITETWVDAALNLTKRDLKMMDRLVQRQSARVRA